MADEKIRTKTRTKTRRDGRLWAVVPEELAQRVQEWARARDISVSEAVNHMVKYYFRYDQSKDKSE